MTDTQRQPYDPEFTAWVARGMDEETLSKWKREAERVARRLARQEED